MSAGASIPGDNSPLVTIVIPTRNGGADFRECLEQIQSQSVDFEYEVLIVDSGSTDGTLEVARKQGCRVLEIAPADFNHGDTRNLGIGESRATYVALLVQDALPADKNWLSSLIHPLRNDPDVAGSYSRQIPRSDCNPHLRIRLENWSAGRQRAVIQSMGSLSRFESLSPLEKLETIAFDNVSSCVRREVWSKMPFPRAEFGEDVGWARQVLEEGWKIAYEPGSAVVHSHNHSIWYEFLRVYRDHQNLHRLVAINQVPTLVSVFSGTGAALRSFVSLSKDLRLGFWARIYWIAYGVPFYFGQTLAQHLGPRSVYWRSRPWFRALDARLGRRV